MSSARDPGPGPGPDPFARDDAAYVLGALGPADRRAYEVHLSTCARCRTAVTELSGLPGLLGLVPEEQVAPPAHDPGPLPETVLPGLVARVRRDRRRRRAVALASALAAACLLVALVLAVLPGRTGSPAGGSVLTALSPVRPVPVTATVRLQPVSWGTRVQVSCTYDGPAPATGGARARYRLVVVPTGGRTPQQVADWGDLPGSDVVADGSTALALDEVAQVELQADDGTVLLQGAPARPRTGG